MILLPRRDLILPSRDIRRARGFTEEDYARHAFKRRPFVCPPLFPQVEKWAGFTKGVGPTEGTNAAGSPAVTLAGTTAGRRVVVGVLAETTTVSSVTCTGETFTLRGVGISAQGFTLQVADCTGLASGGNKVITANVTGTPSAQIVAMEVVESITYDTQASTNSAGSTNGTVNMTVASAGSLVIVIELNKGGAVTAGTGFTTMGLTDFVFFDGGEYNLNASSGSNTCGFTHATGAWTILAASWSPAASATRPVKMAGEWGGYAGVGGGFAG